MTLVTDSPLGANWENCVEKGLWRTTSPSFWHIVTEKNTGLFRSVMSLSSLTWKYGGNSARLWGTCSIYSPCDTIDRICLCTSLKKPRNGTQKMDPGKRRSWKMEIGEFELELFRVMYCLWFPLRSYWSSFPTRSKSPRGHRSPSYPRHLAVTQWW